MHEIPIFLSQKLSPNLHLFQYPVTDRIAVPESALNKGHKINARWKPLSKRFELEVRSFKLCFPSLQLELNFLRSNSSCRSLSSLG